MKQLLIIISLIGFFSCSNVNKDVSENLQPEKININVTSQIKTLYPPAINDISSMQVASQIYEGLVKYNPFDLKVLPAIAESWKISDDMSVYTFYLRKDVFFHDNACFAEGKGRKVTADDVKFTFTQLCSQQHNNNNFISTLYKVVGAQDYYEQSKDGVPTIDIAGLQVVDEFTIKIVLTKPMPYFLNSLALASAGVFPKEAFDKYGEKMYVGSGPYMINSYPETNEIVLLKNIDYYRVDENNVRLPYIDTVFVGIEKSVLADMKEFEKGNLNIIMSIPEAYISEFMEKNITKFESNPPKYTINKYSESGSSIMYNLYNSNIHNFFTNDLNVIDMSLVYYEEPLPSKKDSVQ